MALHLKREKCEPFFPHDIILNILKRLPLKSRTRFRCVCKDWNDPFKTPFFFIKHHLHLSTNHDIPSLLIHQFSYTERNYGLLDPVTKTLMPLDRPSDHHHYSHHRISGIIGSSNGLICLDSNNGTTFFLWNPATREVQNVSKSENDYWYAIGFGFNKALNDYKMVGIHDLSRVDVFSLSTWSWKEVQHDMLEGVVDLKGGIPNTFTATDEAIHWIIFNNRGHHKLFILSFDTSREVFTLIPFPKSSLTQLSNIKLITHENKLALLSSTELWVIEEVATSCGSGQRWHNIKFNISDGLSNFNPLTIWRNEVVFIPRPPLPSNQENRICLYNLTTHEFKELLIAPGYSRVTSAFNYVERIVPIYNED